MDGVSGTRGESRVTRRSGIAADKRIGRDSEKGGNPTDSIHQLAFAPPGIELGLGIGSRLVLEWKWIGTDWIGFGSDLSRLSHDYSCPSASSSSLVSLTLA